MKSLLMTAAILGLLCSLPSLAKEADDPSPTSVTVETTRHVIRPSFLEARQPTTEADRVSRYSVRTKDCPFVGALSHLAWGFTGGLAATLLISMAFLCPDCKLRRKSKLGQD